MLVPACVLAFFSVMIEMVLVTKVAFTRRILIKYEMLGLFFSFALSVALGYPFNAQGVTALMGAMISTGVTLIIYKLHLLKYWDEFVATTDERHAKFAAYQTSCRKFWRELKGTVKWIWWCISFPYRAFVWIKNLMDGAASAASRVKNRMVRP